MTKHLAAIEAVLFASGEPLDISKIAAAVDLNMEETTRLIFHLQNKLEQEESGLCVLRLDDKFQLTTRSEYAQQVRKVLDISRNTPLSNAALEVLALICYNQPVTKAFIEQVRGVDCSGVVTSLVQKGLIEEKGRLDLPGKPLVYGTTTHFLKCFCLSSLEELPPLPNKEMELQEGEDGVEDLRLAEV